MSKDGIQRSKTTVICSGSRFISSRWTIFSVSWLFRVFFHLRPPFLFSSSHLKKDGIQRLKTTVMSSDPSFYVVQVERCVRLFSGCLAPLFSTSPTFSSSSRSHSHRLHGAFGDVVNWEIDNPCIIAAFRWYRDTSTACFAADYVCTSDNIATPSSVSRALFFRVWSNTPKFVPCPLPKTKQLRWHSAHSLAMCTLLRHTWKPLTKQHNNTTLCRYFWITVWKKTVRFTTLVTHCLIPV